MKTSVKAGIAIVGLYLLAKHANKKKTQDCTCTHPAPSSETVYTPGINPNPKPRAELSASLAGKLVG